MSPEAAFVGVCQAAAETLPREWDAAALQVARQFADAWLTESRTARRVIPSVVVRAEFNVRVNPARPDAARIVVAGPQPVVWDERLLVLPPSGQSWSLDGGPRLSCHDGTIVGSNSDFAQRVTATVGAAGELTPTFAIRRAVMILLRGTQVRDVVTVFRFRVGADLCFEAVNQNSSTTRYRLII
ncbi:RES family NAD+ phosphorylase [Burkholderia sp. AU28863]|uniref:RES family NAD+ phosphorylase n=1 Tax=Burkholderia sp. AU28863 TaxID=2015352 RepID=UPI00211B07E4|nr:RES domain-containing protein [Burkholderia sp. AU28863]